MTEAANVLHVTQPTLSRQIADLERELGVELFERTNRSCVLTSDGMRLRQRAEEIVSLVEQTESEWQIGSLALRAISALALARPSRCGWCSALCGAAS